MSQFWEICE